MTGFPMISRGASALFVGAGVGAGVVVCGVVVFGIGISFALLLDCNASAFASAFVKLLLSHTSSLGMRSRLPIDFIFRGLGPVPVLKRAFFQGFAGLFPA